MPKKKKEKKKIKKATSSSFEELYVDTIKNRDTSKKQKKFEKNFIDFEKDAGMGPKNFDKVFLTNVFGVARTIKDYKQLESFIELYAPGMAAADVAVAAAKYAKDNWNVFKIAKDPDCQGAIFELLDAIDKKNAKRIYNSQTLKRFCMLTGYKKPRTDKTFQEQVTMFKKNFNLNRKKKKVAQFRDKEFKI